MIRDYYRLAKPGIVYGNLLSVVAGLMLASSGNINFGLFLATVFGISFVMACGCVLNNYLDRGIDEKMERTRTRASVTGKIPLRNGIIYATILGLGGLGLLFFYTNTLTTAIAFAGLVIYVVIYGFFKRRTSFGTIVGSVAGAVPPLVGYVAVSGKLDLGAWIIFLILVFWQMPHFYSIAIFRIKDYAAASIPVLPITAGARTTKIAILGFIVLFTLTAISLTVFRYTGIVYAVVLGMLGAWWFVQGLAGFSTPDDFKWARKMFFNSLVVLLVTCVSISVGGFLP